MSPPSVSFLSLSWEVSKMQFSSWARGGLDCFRDIIALIDLLAFRWVMFSSSCFPLTRVVLFSCCLSFFVHFLLVKNNEHSPGLEAVFLLSPGIGRGCSTVGCLWMMAELLSPQLFSSPRSSSAKASYSLNFLLPCNICAEVVKAPEGILSNRCLHF